MVGSSGSVLGAVAAATVGARGVSRPTRPRNVKCRFENARNIISGFEMSMVPKSHNGMTVKSISHRGRYMSGSHFAHFDLITTQHLRRSQTPLKEGSPTVSLLCSYCVATARALHQSHRVAVL